MILIVGKYDPLAECLAEKFRDRHYGGDVLVKNSTRLVDYLIAHASDIEMLFYLDKRHQREQDEHSRLDHIQLLWTITARLSIPVTFMFFKHYSDFSVDGQVEKFAVWTEKQFRKPPVNYLFKVGELYGLADKESVVDEYCHMLLETGVVTVNRCKHESEFKERQLDHVYVRDLLRVFYWFAVHHPESGVYELGSGFSRTDSAVASAVFRAFGFPRCIKFVDIVKDTDMSKFPVMEMDLSHLRYVGYKKPFYTIEKGVKSYAKRTF